MQAAQDITWLNLGIGYLLLIIPISALAYFRTGLVKDSLIAVLRMSIQLYLVGLYLEYIFRWNNAYINLGWILVMLFIAAFTINRRGRLRNKYFFWPAFAALLLSFVLVDLYFLGLVLRLDNLFDAKYFIPITGMLLGNCIHTNVIALHAFYGELDSRKDFYRYALANGAKHGEALAPFIKSALQKAFNPAIATMAVIGLISLPGMMTGQILGGNSPMVAIKYQILLMITIFVTTMLSVLLTILFANRFLFDEYKNLKENVVRVE